jgi:hypothetical protein
VEPLVPTDVVVVDVPLEPPPPVELVVVPVVPLVVELPMPPLPGPTVTVPVVPAVANDPLAPPNPWSSSGSPWAQATADAIERKYSTRASERMGALWYGISVLAWPADRMSIHRNITSNCQCVAGRHRFRGKRRFQ